MKTYFVTGIGTDVGKTVSSAILTEALEADYWKPIQTGIKDGHDHKMVLKLISNDKTIIHPETYALLEPFAPHASARLENIEIELHKFAIPKTENHLVIEGAGGIMVPLNDKESLLDLMIKLDLEVILVSRNYLGSINHTMMSIEVLKKNNIKIKGIIFNGPRNVETENWIEKNSGVQVLLRIGHEATLNKEAIKKYADELRNSGVLN